ncbi:MAG TPA: Txe/YoeB family addiction module toxin [Bacteroidales bacterium]|nr:Txe/YoeB family addiction module toxin [Bacteroidales bacterium]
MRQIYFDSDAFDDFCNWAIYDKQIFKKILELLKSIKRTPFQGIGKPELLKFDKSGYWSRRITDEHRLIYKVDEHSNIFIASCRGHYS